MIVAGNSERALSTAEKREVDAVISDLNRPGMKGLQFLKAFKEAHPETPVVILSGSLDETSARRALRLGAFRCMFKPVTVDEILKVVGEALKQRTTRLTVATGSRFLAKKRSRKAAA
ncbi:MAG: response regulator [Verrucomicrobiia bacterium]